MRDAALHRIVQPFPLRLTLRPGEPGFRKEYNILRETAGHGGLRFVEWRRNPGVVEAFCRADAEAVMEKNERG